MPTFRIFHLPTLMPLFALLGACALTSCSAGNDSTPNVTQNDPGSLGQNDPLGVTPLPPIGDITDPLFSSQWHLFNTGQGGGQEGEDVRVRGPWAQGLSGRGVRIAIVDDGLEIRHEDLAPNVIPGQSFNYLTNGNDPTPATTGLCEGAGGDAACHGTSAAGVAAGFANRLGGRGAAPYANLVGYNLLSSSFTPDSREADAMVRNVGAVWVSNNSWGAPDDGVLHPSGPLWKTAVLNGVATGRGGRGTIYTWAGGNGGRRRGDNSNYEGYANFRGVMAICAVDAAGKQPAYSDPGANLWGCTTSSSGGSGLPSVLTTDRSGGEGYNQGSGGDVPDANYTNSFGGTSSATALASGVVALVLEANPALSWRDLRQVLAETARQNDPSDSDWTINGAGYHVNHKYGFGVFNAEAAVARARIWSAVGPQKTFTLSGEGSRALADLASIDLAATVAGSGIQRIEWIEIEFAADHQNDGDLRIVLRNDTTGTRSVLAESRTCTGVETCGNYSGWVFSSARHLGEAADGRWTLTVTDGLGGNTGTITGWKLTFYGT